MWEGVNKVFEIENYCTGNDENTTFFRQWKTVMICLQLIDRNSKNWENDFDIRLVDQIQNSRMKKVSAY